MTEDDLLIIPGSHTRARRDRCSRGTQTEHDAHQWALPGELPEVSNAVRELIIR